MKQIMKRPTTKANISLWAKSIASCTKCEVSALCTHKVTHRTHQSLDTSHIDILLIGEAPGQSEYNNKEPFVGPAGYTLDDILAEALPPHMSYLITNAILCTPWTDESRSDLRQPYLSEIVGCGEHLTNLCRRIKPKYVIALGKVAEKSIIQINRHYQLPPHLAIMHPSRIMQSTKYQYDFDNAVLKIKEYLNA